MRSCASTGGRQISWAGVNLVSSGRRVLVWSHRGLNTAPFRCVGYEFEDVIAQIEPDATIVAPTPFVRSPSNRLINVVSRDARLRIPASLGYRRPALDDEYDLFFANFQFLPDLDSLRAIPHWQQRARRSVCVIEELWARDLPRWKTLPRLLSGFDHVFLECSGSVEPLQEITGIPCSFLPPGVDALRFCPTPAPPRVVDVCRVGRRDAALHASLLDAYKRGEIFYEFDSVRPENVWDPAEHREHLAGLLKRTRYVIVNPGKYNQHNETSGQQELGFRFFEGAAAGAVMIGQAPRVPSFDENFDWPDAVIEVAGDSVLDADRRARRRSRSSRADTTRQRLELAPQTRLGIPVGAGARRRRTAGLRCRRRAQAQARGTGVDNRRGGRYRSSERRASSTRARSFASVALSSARRDASPSSADAVASRTARAIA